MSSSVVFFYAKFDMVLDNSLLTASDTAQFQAATKSLAGAIKSNPSLAEQFTAKQLEQINSGSAKISDFTWHHHQDTGRMQLVDTTIHSKTGHTGGKSIWGGGR